MHACAGVNGERANTTFMGWVTSANATSEPIVFANTPALISAANFSRWDRAPHMAAACACACACINPSAGFVPRPSLVAAKALQNEVELFKGMPPPPCVCTHKAS